MTGVTVMHRKLKQDGLRKTFQQVFAGLDQSAKLNLLVELLLEISALRSLGTQLKIGKGTPDLRHRSMAVRFLDYLFVALKSRGGKLMDAVMESIRGLYTSTIGIMGGETQNYSTLSKSCRRGTVETNIQAD